MPQRVNPRIQDYLYSGGSANDGEHGQHSASEEGSGFEPAGYEAHPAEAEVLATARSPAGQAELDSLEAELQALAAELGTLPERSRIVTTLHAYAELVEEQRAELERLHEELERFQGRAGNLPANADASLSPERHGLATTPWTTGVRSLSASPTRVTDEPAGGGSDGPSEHPFTAGAHEAIVAHQTDRTHVENRKHPTQGGHKAFIDGGQPDGVSVDLDFEQFLGQQLETVECNREAAFVVARRAFYGTYFNALFPNHRPTAFVGTGTLAAHPRTGGFLMPADSMEVGFAIYQRYVQVRPEALRPYRSV